MTRADRLLKAIGDAVERERGRIDACSEPWEYRIVVKPGGAGMRVAIELQTAMVEV